MTGQGSDIALPALRAELDLLPGPADIHGQPTWLVHDPLQNRFTKIDIATREALKHWRSCSTAADLVARVNLESRVRLDEQSVLALIDFLYASEMTETRKADGWKGYARAKDARKQSPAAWLMHNYLFFRIPLVRPQHHLERTLPFVRVLWSRAAIVWLAVTAIAGLYLCSRQWEQFLATLMSYLSWEGLFTGAVALALVKIAHELGHAFAAVALGARVHTMGIAFVVMAPMPYTDVTDAWRLTDRRKRLLIDSAGMLVEAGIAAIALFAWSFVPDGPLRSTAFVLSAVSIVSSLAINLNPFMRFDGYYLLSELLGVENLQSRAFNIGVWKLRESLFGLGAPCPESLPDRRVTFLVWYAWMVWLYRLVLFTGIALLVYHYFFKVLGIVLFAVEIIYFIASPIFGELQVWWNLKARIMATRRTRITVAAASLVLLAMLFPWSSTAEIPAVLEAAELQSLYPVRSARVITVSVKHGDAVKSGTTIAVLASSEIDDEIKRTQISLRIAQLQYGRRMADSADKEASLVLESSISAMQGKIDGLMKEQAELTVVAPFDGRIVDLNPELLVGRWVSPRDMIAIVASKEKLVAHGYAAEADIERIERGARAMFIPEHPSRSRVELRIERIATGGAAQIEFPDLASTNTGRIPVTIDERRRLIPVTAQYLVTMSATAPVSENDLAVRGIAFTEARAESILGRAWRRALGILIRESGV